MHFSNWTKRWICGNCQLVNDQIKSNKYATSIVNEIFDAIGCVKVFNILDLSLGYHKLLVMEVDKQKTTFWGIDEHGKDGMYQW